MEARAITGLLSGLKFHADSEEPPERVQLIEKPADVCLGSKEQPSRHVYLSAQTHNRIDPRLLAGGGGREFLFQRGRDFFGQILFNFATRS